MSEKLEYVAHVLELGDVQNAIGIVIQSVEQHPKELLPSHLES